MPADNTIWVYAELSCKAPALVALELLAKARELQKKAGGKVVAVLLGHATGAAAETLLAFGADTVIRAESENLRDYKPVPYAETMAALIRKHAPSIVLFGATAQGRDLAPRLQAKLRTGLTADCLDLDIDADGLLAQIKPSYGDNVMCTITCPEARPQMATVRPRIFTPREKAVEVRGTVLDEAVDVAPDPDYEIVATAPSAACGLDIGEADVIVALGRGAGSDEAVAAAQELAGALNGVLAVTRPLTEDGRFPHDCQIGQSGRTVKPKCILNFGISGALQYTAGMRDAGLIISVDKSKDAPIFASSHAGYVGDALEMIRAVAREVNRRK